MKQGGRGTQSKGSQVTQRCGPKKTRGGGRGALETKGGQIKTRKGLLKPRASHKTQGGHMKPHKTNVIQLDIILERRGQSEQAVGNTLGIYLEKTRATRAQE